MKKFLGKKISPRQTVLKIGSRSSPLAIAQVQEVLDQLKIHHEQIAYELKTFATAGDKDKKTPLTHSVSDNFFTNTLDHAVSKGVIDIAVHSAKDLPQNLPEDLIIAALTPCLDDSDAFVGNGPFDQLPSGARVGTSSLLRQESLKSLRDDVKLVNIRGTIQERIALIRQGKLDGIIVATCALKRLKQDHLIQSVFPWEGTPLQGQLAIVCRRDNINVIDLFRPMDVRRQYGRVRLVGAGPGDPELITLKAIDALKKADCVFYDYLVDPLLMRYAPGAEHIYVGKRKGAHSIHQAELSRQIRLKAMSGKNVVRLKGGDPLIFGRGAEELAYLRSYHIETDVVPGVSSATGLPSLLGVPLTARGISSSVAFISAHGEDETSIRSSVIRIPETQTVVVLMGLTKIGKIIKAFYVKGWAKETPVLIVSHGSCRNQQVVQGTLATIERILSKHPVEAPALIIVGKTTDFYKPVSVRKTILFLGTHPQEYAALGKIVHWPMIAIKPRTFSIQERKKIVRRLMESRLILLTSEYAVEHFQNFLKQSKMDIKTLTNVEFAVIGSFTAQALIDRGAYPKFIASTETAKGVYLELKKRLRLKGLKILFPRSSLPNPYLKKAMTKSGADVFEFAVYENIKPKQRPLPDEAIEAVMFTSPSTVVNFLKDYKKIPSSWTIYCKGPVSQKALAEHGYQGKILHG